MRNIRGGRIPNLAAFHLLLHEGRGARNTDHDGGVINYAMAIAERSELGLPFFSAMEFTFAARRSFDMGLYSQAVLETGTAIELLVNRVVRGVELDKGSSEERIENVLETAFMNLVKDHLAKKLGVTVDKQFSGSDPLNNWLRIAYNSATGLRTQAIALRGLLAERARVGIRGGGLWVGWQQPAARLAGDVRALKHAY
ncbi:MAG TPA: hypothetical protein VID29_07120 [Solirubrobacteraceae bacterium]|jgi:hypothetical protein